MVMRQRNFLSPFNGRMEKGYREFVFNFKEVTAIDKAGLGQLFMTGMNFVKKAVPGVLLILHIIFGSNWICAIYPASHPLFTGNSKRGRSRDIRLVEFPETILAGAHYPRFLSHEIFFPMTLRRRKECLSRRTGVKMPRSSI